MQIFSNLASYFCRLAATLAAIGCLVFSGCQVLDLPYKSFDEQAASVGSSLRAPDKNRTGFGLSPAAQRIESNLGISDSSD